MKIILEMGAGNVNGRDLVNILNSKICIQFQRTPLIEACIHDARECVTLLIQYNANINLQNKYQNTPLHVAAANNNIEVAKILIEFKADIMKRNYVRTSY